MIMQQEQEAAGVLTKRAADKAIEASAATTTAQIDLTDAMAQRATTAAQQASMIDTAAEQPAIDELQEQMQDMASFSPSEQTELTSTDEVLDLFSSYFEADVADAQISQRTIVTEKIDTDLDFNSRVFEGNYISRPVPSPLQQTQGDHTGDFDIRQFVAR